jgi:hypothetical protein
VTRVQELREEAANKHRQAELARIAGRFTVKERDQEIMLELANELEAEAARLDEQAIAIEDQGRGEQAN